MEPAPPDAYDSRYSKWNMDDLPIIPREWRYLVLPATKKQYDILTALMLDERVEELKINPHYPQGHKSAYQRNFAELC